MKYLINKTRKHLLWKDELYDIKDSTKHTFLLLKYAEVYRYTKNTLRLHIWSTSKLSQLLKKGLIYDVTTLDEGFTIADAKVTDLPHLIALGTFKRRPNINGKWIKSREKILAHRILPYKPVIFK
ncbi:MAG: hypothetical protein P9M02_02285 [Candidatus Susulua stagnicola]|nr:hypothetical protein [Candidatus Susulua stagnicola]